MNNTKTDLRLPLAAGHTSDDPLYLLEDETDVLDSAQTTRSGYMSTVLSAVLAGTGLIAIGSGGAPTLPEFQSTNDSAVIIVTSHFSSETLSAQALPSQIAMIRNFMSLNISDLARVLQVERPTVYAWINESRSPHASNLERLKQVYMIAMEWKQISGRPIANLINVPFQDGTTTFELLCKDEIDLTVIKGKLKEILASQGKIVAESMRKNDRLGQLAKKHGFSPIPDQFVRDAIEDEAQHVRFPDDD